MATTSSPVAEESVIPDPLGCRNWTDFPANHEPYAWTSPCPHRPKLDPSIYCFDAMTKTLWGMMYYHTKLYFTIYVYIISIIGISGNALILVVLRSEKRSPVTTLLRMMAVFDSLTLLTAIHATTSSLYTYMPNAFTLWLRFGFFDTHVTFFYTFSQNLAYPTSKWLVVIMAIERFIAVYFPLKASTICTVKNTMFSVSVVFLVVVVVHMPYIDTEFVTYYCDCCTGLGIPSGVGRRPFWVGNSYFRVNYYVLLVLFRVLPIAAVVSANILILLRVRMAGKAREEMSGKKDSDSLKLVIAISIMFLAMEIPAFIYTLGRITGFLSELGSLRTVVSNTVSGISFLNSTMNFYLYCLASERFRKKLLTMIPYTSKS